MADVTINIGGKQFDVACQDGEEDLLHAAASLLDAEAEALRAQVGRMPEARMLLMAGLMLADKTAAMTDRMRQLEAELGQAQQRIALLENQPKPTPERIEVPVIPRHVHDTLAELAARSEALAAAVEDRVREANATLDPEESPARET
ncbi:cell division protein ZapA [Plastorhodobacter daqingensis]|uniref:Cell division protein ZapA n=1 Tax=Plastorhodobacter daqingensis TaxID=1387281 RepID=A0ABW2UH25_9RHOB